MKTLLFFLLAVRCFAASVTVAWDPNAEQGIAYTLEAKAGAELDPGEWKPVASTPLTQITVTSLRPGLWSFRVRAVSITDEDAVSEPSEIVTTIIRPDKPKGLRIVLESSRDMESWQPVATYEVPDLDRAFYRIEFVQ